MSESLPSPLEAMRRWSEIDFSKIEERALAMGFDPGGQDRTALFSGDRADVMAAFYGCGTPIVTIIDEGHLIADIETDLFEPKCSEKPEQPAEANPVNRKQRRADAAKERQKPRGQRRRMILDIETYDPNRTKDWQR